MPKSKRKRLPPAPHRPALISDETGRKAVRAPPRAPGWDFSAHKPRFKAGEHHFGACRRHEKAGYSDKRAKYAAHIGCSEICIQARWERRASLCPSIWRATIAAADETPSWPLAGASLRLAKSASGTTTSVPTGVLPGLLRNRRASGAMNCAPTTFQQGINVPNLIRVPPFGEVCKERRPPAAPTQRAGGTSVVWRRRWSSRMRRGIDLPLSACHARKHLLVLRSAALPGRVVPARESPGFQTAS